MTNNKDNSEKYANDLARYENIIKYFIRNSDRKVPQNVGYLQDVVNSLVNIYSVIDNAVVYDTNSLKMILIKERSDYLLNKLEGILSKDLKNKLNSIKASREEKKGSIVDQWIGELI